MSSRRPDGGWGWAVVLGAIVIQALFGSIIRGFGVVYLRLIEHYSSSATATSWVGTSFLITWGVTGPIGGVLMRRWSCRSVASVGSLVLALGLITTGLAPSLLVVYVTYAIAGFGLSLAFNASFLIVDRYFDQRKAFAMGATTLGAAIGMFSLPPVVEIFFDQYGYQGGMLMYAGIALQGCIAATLFFPLKKPKPNYLNTDRKMFNDNPKVEIKIEPERIDNANELAGPKKDQVYVKRIFNSIRVYFSLLKKPLLLGMASMNFSLFFTICFVGSFAPALAVDNGISYKMAVLLVTANGGMDGLGKLITTFVFDVRNMKRIRPHAYAILGLLSGVSACFIPVSPEYVTLILFCCIFGLVNGGVGGQRTTILADLVLSDEMPDALGLMVVFNSLGCVSSGLIGGVIRDATGRYDLGFYTAGTTMCLSSLGLLTLLTRCTPKAT